MGRFLRENWKWVVVPIVVVILALLAAAFFGRGEDTSPFQYKDY